MPGPSLWSADRRALTIGLILTTTFVASESLAVSTVMPVVADDLGDLPLYGWVFAGFFLGNLVGIALAGREVDRHGLVRPFAIGLGLFAAGLVLGGIAPSMPILVAARILQGIGAGFEPPVAYVAAGRHYPDVLRPRLFCWLSVAWVLPGIAGPALAAGVAGAFGWRIVFLGLLPLIAVAGWLTLRALAAASQARVRAGSPGVTASRGTIVDRGRLWLAVRLAIGGGLLVASSTLDLRGLALPGIVAFIAAPLVAGLGLALGIPAFRRLTPAGTLSARRGLPAAILLRGFLTFAFFGADPYVPYLLVTVRGADVALGGIALTAATVAWTAGAWIQARLMAQLGPRPLIAAGFAVLALGVAGLLPVLDPATPVELAVATFGVAGLGMGLAYSPLSIVMLRVAPAGGEGAASSALSLSDVLGTALGTGLAGALLAAAVGLGAGEAAGLAAAFGASIVVALGGLALARRLP